VDGSIWTSGADAELPWLCIVQTALPARATPLAISSPAIKFRLIIPLIFRRARKPVKAAFEAVGGRAGEERGGEG
jgi:hypothetical protein